MSETPRITVRTFYEAAREACHLEFEAGERYLKRPITETAINRPGLALTGYFRHFANKRIQVLGLAENTYLRDLDPDARYDSIQRMMEQRVPCVILSRSRHASPEMKECAQQARIPVMRSDMITSRLVNRCTLILEELSAPSERVHGTMIDIAGIGVLLKGRAAVGKSETALGLVERGHSLVSDDLTILTRHSSGVIIGKSDDITRYHMEIRGLGIVKIPSLFGMASIRKEKQVDLIINLHRSDDLEGEADRTGLDQEHADVLGVAIPQIDMPVSVGRDMANVVEVAAMNQKLKILGYDAAKEFNDKLIALMNQPKGRKRK